LERSQKNVGYGLFVLAVCIAMVYMEYRDGSIPVAPALRVFAYSSYIKGFDVTMDNSPYVGDMWLDK
jgi:hypothetical protein